MQRKRLNTVNTNLLIKNTIFVEKMIPRIKSVQPLENYILLVEFDNGQKVGYDVKDDIKTLTGFSALESEYGLFQNVQLDSSRTCVYWTDCIVIPSFKIFYCGTPITYNK